MIGDTARNISVTYPKVTDPDMAELGNFERMLHAIIQPVFAGYPNPTEQQVGNMLKQAKILAQSIYASCEEIEARFIAAETTAVMNETEELL